MSFLPFNRFALFREYELIDHASMMLDLPIGDGYQLGSSEIISECFALSGGPVSRP